MAGVAGLLLLLVSACGGDTAAPAGQSAPAPAAVTVASGYRPPEDRVPSTGAYLPANGKPTLVFVDAIW